MSDSLDSDALVKRGQAGEISGDAMIAQMLTLDVFAPSRTQMVGDTWEGFGPIMYDRGGTLMIAVFTHRDFVNKHRDLAPHVLQVNFYALIEPLRADYGIVVNPGEAYAFELQPENLAAIRKELKAR